MVWCHQTTSHQWSPEPMLTQIYFTIWHHWVTDLFHHMVSQIYFTIWRHRSISPYGLTGSQIYFIIWRHRSISPYESLGHRSISPYGVTGSQIYFIIWRHWVTIELMRTHSPWQLYFKVKLKPNQWSHHKDKTGSWPSNGKPHTWKDVFYIEIRLRCPLSTYSHWVAWSERGFQWDINLSFQG